MGTIRFADCNCTVERHRYQNGRVALQLITHDDGFPEPVATATVNVPDCDLADDEVIIKDYSENRGILDILIGAGIVYPPERYARLNHVEVPICRLVQSGA